MNNVCLSGRLTRDPDVRYTQGAEPTAIARFTLAVDRRFNREEQTADFISCVAFGKSGQLVEKYFHKGMKMNLVGRIQTGSYRGKEGKIVYTTDVIAEQIEFGESKQESQQGFQQQQFAPQQSFQPRQAEPQQQQFTTDGFMNIPDSVDDEDLPFG